MIYQDENGFYLKLPRHVASALTKAVVQACFSMKQDQNSPNHSLYHAEISLLQLANLIHNAQPLPEDIKKEFKEEENTNEPTSIE